MATLLSHAARGSTLVRRCCGRSVLRCAAAPAAVATDQGGVAGRRWMASSYPPHEVVGMPSLSPTMESGQIANWNKSEGDEFKAGDIFCEVQTDKATVDFEAQDDGIIARILAEAGPDEIQCGEPIMITVSDADDVDAFKDYKVDPHSAPSGGSAPPPPPPEASAPPPPPPPAPTPPPPAAAPAPTAAPSAPASPPSSSPSSGRIVASPLAFKLAKELGRDIGAIVGTGPGGRVIADDVREFVPAEATAAAAPAEAAAPQQVAAATPATPAPAVAAAPPVVGAGYTDYPLSDAAREAAARLTNSKRNVPHYYLMADVRLDEMLKLRASLNEAASGGKRGGGDDDDSDEDLITLNDLLIKAAACAMGTVPSANASWMDTAVRVYDSVDVNVHVGGGDGLYAPLIRNVDTSGIKAISASIAEAARAAAEGTLSAESCAVGTFSVINLGMYGIKSCAPIIVEPQACMLALGAAENRIIPRDVGGEGDDDGEIYQEAVMLTATLSCDHRVVDGAVGAQWLSAFKSHVENPATLLL